MSATEKHLLSIYDENRSRIVALAFRLSGNKEDAEDIIQQSFINAYRNIEKFRGDSSLLTWIYRIIVNTASKQYRQRELPIEEFSKKSGIPQNELYSQLNSSSHSAAIVNNQIVESCLQMFLHCMPARLRTVFTLRVILKLDTEICSEILETTPGNIKTLLYRSRKFLQAKTESRCGLINPANPCKCHLWNKPEDNSSGRKELTTEYPFQTPDFKSLYIEEMTYLNQLTLLFSREPADEKSSEYINSLKKIISEKKLGLLS